MTWVYLSSLLMIGLYFKFGRFWSVRNLDLVLLILLAPGLLIAQFGGEDRARAERMAAADGSRAETPGEVVAADVAGPEVQPEGPALPPATAGSASGVIPEESPEEPLESARGPALGEGKIGRDLGQQTDAPTSDRRGGIELFGFLWLFAIGTVWLVRLLLDPTMVRRPLLEPNLTTGGLIFIGASLFVFLMANVWTSQRFQAAPRLAQTGVESVSAEAASGGPEGSAGEGMRRGPGYPLLNLVPSIPTMPLVPEGMPTTSQQRTYAIVAKVIAVLCHLAVVLGIVAIGYWHFGNTKTGAGVATLYLMLPYTAQMTGHIDHVIPAALLVWAILCYRRPLTSGMLLAIATGLVYYPLFLLPLWVSFYWRRGLMRFAIGVVVTLTVMAVALVFIPHASYWENLKQMFGLWLPLQEGLQGIWGLGWDPVYRIPVLAGFFALSFTLAIWPPQKNLGTLLSCSAAVMVATQFWHGYGGGLYMGWYLPLTLLTMFRPNLEDRVALAVLGEGWNRWRTASPVSGTRAA
ncbi:MAG: DUF2029 domain-containing protein [Pirellulaceae bacterium]|nr:DUF2029 domain-containing protein [Pirellulaceae bacterium]